MATTISGRLEERDLAARQVADRDDDDSSSSRALERTNAITLPSLE